MTRGHKCVCVKSSIAHGTACLKKTNKKRLRFEGPGLFNLLLDWLHHSCNLWTKTLTLRASCDQFYIVKRTLDLPRLDGEGRATGRVTSPAEEDWPDPEGLLITLPLNRVVTIHQIDNLIIFCPFLRILSVFPVFSCFVWVLVFWTLDGLWILPCPFGYVCLTSDKHNWTIIHLVGWSAFALSVTVFSGISCDIC